MAAVMVILGAAAAPEVEKGDLECGPTETSVGKQLLGLGHGDVIGL
jgi:hypothetical protein